MWTFDLLGNEKKPEKFENRKLGSERLADKKFNFYRRFFQNNYTHFNYYYNANNKIRMVLEKAKESQQDDFTKLLSYYPYSLENTSSQKTELDSVIYKSNAGILLHDLRNAWIDNMYLLMGQAYFFRKDFDSAAATFQFINYNLFPRKKNEEDNKIVGSNENMGSGTVSIANKEKRNIYQKAFEQPPSRNDALIWLAKTLIEQNEFGDASGLIHTLQQDPNLPKRLRDDLNDITAYLFYKQELYDSTAVYLEQALTVTNSKQDKARAEFLLAQLWERSGNYEKAGTYYNLASSHTSLPMLDIYAQMNNAIMRRGNDTKELDKGISNLVGLTKKDNFESYRDILYFAAGELAIIKPDTGQAIKFYTKSYQLNENRITYKNKAFIKLADIAYTQKKYPEAYRYYDSLQDGDSALADNIEDLQKRRNALSKIVEKIGLIHLEDSLQLIAAMPSPAREAYVKKLSRKLRKEKGLKEEENFDQGPSLTFSNSDKPSTNLFDGQKATGEWYFYNSSLKSKGFSEFKRKWGVRTNTDNWRRKSATPTAAPVIVQQDNFGGMDNMNPDAVVDPPKVAPGKDQANKSADGNLSTGVKFINGAANTSTSNQTEDYSYEGLMSNLPLTPERLMASNQKLAAAWYELGKLYQNELEDYKEAINTYDTCLFKYPDSLYNGELYLNMYYCYNKLGDKINAQKYKTLLAQKFDTSQAYKIVNNPDQINSGERKREANKIYDTIYNKFIEGNFEEAITLKVNADSVFGKTYWTPQLLYIEAVYFIKQRCDSEALVVLTNICNLYPNSKLKSKADQLIQVLGKRASIEDYLTKLEVTRKADDTIAIEPVRVRMVRNDSNLIVSPSHLIDTSKSNITQVKQIPSVAKDSLIKAPQVVQGPYSISLTNKHQVVMILDKVDGTYIKESKNGLERYVNYSFAGKGIVVSRDVLDGDKSLIIFSEFADANEALQFLIKIRKAAPIELSWLPKEKYQFVLVDNDNLQRMKFSKDINGYLNLLKVQFPGQF